MILRKRRNDLFAPAKCCTCGREIELGQLYLSKGHIFQYHTGCIDTTGMTIICAKPLRKELDLIR